MLVVDITVTNTTVLLSWGTIELSSLPLSSVSRKKKQRQYVFLLCTESKMVPLHNEVHLKPQLLLRGRKTFIRKSQVLDSLPTSCSDKYRVKLLGSFLWEMTNLVGIINLKIHTQVHTDVIATC